MATEHWLLVAITLLGGGALFGIFKTKTKGFGRHTTSLVLLTLVLLISALFLAAERIDASLFANIAFAIAGFAGGLITGRAEDAQPGAPADAPQAARR